MGRTIVGATHLIKDLRKPKKRLMKCYQDRNDRFSDLGISYSEYLQSDEWKQIRSKLLSQFPNCVLCGFKSSQVHHTDYEWDTLLGLHLEGLVTLCHKCHQGIEFDGKRKRSLEEANKVLCIGVGQLKTKLSKMWLTRFHHRTKNKLKNKRMEERNERKRDPKKFRKRKIRPKREPKETLVFGRRKKEDARRENEENRARNAIKKKKRKQLMTQKDSVALPHEKENHL